MSDFDALLDSGDPLFEGDRRVRSRQAFDDFGDRWWPYCCVYAFCRSLHGIPTDELDVLDNDLGAAKMSGAWGVHRG